MSEVDTSNGTPTRRAEPVASEVIGTEIKEVDTGSNITAAASSEDDAVLRERERLFSRDVRTAPPIVGNQSMEAADKVLRWSVEEHTKLAEMRVLLVEEFSKIPPYPDVIGDRRLLRFLRGHHHDVNKATMMYKKFLKFREDYNVNAVRNNILQDGLNTPLLFPNGQKILELIPQIVSTVNACDVYGNPLAVESYGFNPSKVIKNLNNDEYLKFVIYTLEYKALFLEQESDRREKEFLRKHDNKPTASPQGYGILLQHCIFRDFNGFSVTNAFQLKKVLEAILPIALDNYPEMMFRSHMVNVPFGFTTIFNFICLFLDPKTKAKITMNASDFKEALKNEIDMDNLPVSLGGKFTLFNEPYEFDISPNGPFFVEMTASQQAGHELTISMDEDLHGHGSTWRDAGDSDSDHGDGKEEDEGEPVPREGSTIGVKDEQLHLQEQEEEGVPSVPILTESVDKLDAVDNALLEREPGGMTMFFCACQTSKNQVAEEQQWMPSAFKTYKGNDM